MDYEIQKHRHSTNILNNDWIPGSKRIVLIALYELNGVSNSVENKIKK